MKATVRDLASNIGGGTSDLARRFGGGTVHVAKTVGSSTAVLAKRVGGSTATLARRIGPRRGLIGVAVLAAVVGGSFYLVRYLRGRAERVEADLDALEEPQTRAAKRALAQSRAQRRASQATLRH